MTGNSHSEVRIPLPIHDASHHSKNGNNEKVEKSTGPLLRLGHDTARRPIDEGGLRLNIAVEPVVGDHPAGNDDAGRAITLYCDLVARAAIDGLERSQVQAGVDIGAAEAPPEEQVPVAVFKGIEAARGEADDLKRLPNVDNKLEQRLNDLGVYHFWQIADLEPDMAEALDRAIRGKGRIAREDWVGAAKKLVESQAV